MADNIKVEPKVFQVTVVKEEPKVSISSSGLQGPPGVNGADGAPGPQGPAGPSQTVSFMFEKQTAEISWTINHNLGYRPAALIQDYHNNTLEGSLQHQSVNTLIISFSDPVSGYAYLS